MNAFEPRTFSTDWEVMVVDRLERRVAQDKLAAVAGVLRREFDLPIGTDDYTLELALGVNSTFPQLWERVRKVTDRAGQILAEFELHLFPLGAHPVEPCFNASHIHVGTLLDETRGIHLQSRLMRWVPAFAALAANSPAAAGRLGGFKSYRVRHRADDCTEPVSIHDPRMSQATWGGDAAPKLYGAPTLEVRIIDCASSRRFLAELATFVAAWVHHEGACPDGCPITPEEYRDALTNRWAAARYGMQAGFHWGGRPVPVAELLDRMLDECGEELAGLGVRRSDLGLIETAVRKRACQADMVLDLAARYPDPYQLASVAGCVLRHWDAFAGYLETAPVLDPVPPPDEAEILEEHLAVIGEGTHFYRTREAMGYPPPVADAILGRLVEEGRIRRELTETRGVALSRIE